MYDYAFLLEALINGTVGNDTLLGTNDGDTINSLGGNDLIRGRSGSDSIKGDNDNDRLYGNEGDDDNILWGGGGNDTFLCEDYEDGISEIRDFSDGDVIAV